jgi:hypothetical protein
MADGNIKPNQENDPSNDGCDPPTPTGKDKVAPPSGDQSNTDPKHEASRHYIKPALKWIWPYLKDATLWTTLATMVIAIATICYVEYSGQQMRIMNGQLTEMKRSNDLTRSLSETTQGAICQPVVQNSSRTPYKYFLVECEAGRLNATLMSGQISVSLQDPQTGSLIGQKKVIDVNRQVIRPGRQSDRIDFEIAGFSDSDFASLKQVIVIEGSLAYDDGFETRTPMNFCYVRHVQRGQDGSYSGEVEDTCNLLPVTLRRYRELDAIDKQYKKNPN